MMIRRLALAAAVLSSLWVSNAAMAGDADFVLVNRTGYAIREIYLTPTHKKSWGKDWLGKRTLGNNQQRQFKLGNWPSCVQDLMVIFDDDGSEAIWEEFDLCELNKITLKYNRKTGEVFADTE